MLWRLRDFRLNGLEHEMIWSENDLPVSDQLFDRSTKKSIILIWKLKIFVDTARLGRLVISRINKFQNLLNNCF